MPNTPEINSIYLQKGKGNLTKDNTSYSDKYLIATKVFDPEYVGGLFNKLSMKGYGDKFIDFLDKALAWWTKPSASKAEKDKILEDFLPLIDPSKTPELNRSKNVL